MNILKRPVFRKLSVRLCAIWRNGGKGIVVVVLALCAFRSAVADWNDVPTGSMKPTILEGDRIFVNKLAYDLKVPFTDWHLAEWSGPSRGDVVVLFSPKDGTRLVKRVVGLPGDLIELRDNRLIVNGDAINYETRDRGTAASPQYIFDEHLDGHTHSIIVTPLRPAPRTIAPVRVPANSYMVMGDNRDNSADSRYFGFVPRGAIVGRATGVVLSFDPEHYYLPRWNRFFRSMP